MTLQEYNQHVTRCAQLVYGLFPGDKAAAKNAVSGTISSMRDRVAGLNADAIQTLRYSACSQAGAAFSMLADAAWAAHVADVKAKIDTLP